MDASQGRRHLQGCVQVLDAIRDHVEPWTLVHFVISNGMSCPSSDNIPAESQGMGCMVINCLHGMHTCNPHQVQTTKEQQ